MPASRRRPKQLPIQAAELAFTAPQIITHRLMRMAVAGHSPSARDKREFHRMGSEKVLAFSESWQAMLVEAFRSQQELFLASMQSIWSMWLGGGLMPLFDQRHFHRAAHDIARHGLAPLHRGVMANKKRLKL